MSRAYIHSTDVADLEIVERFPHLAPRDGEAETVAQLGAQSTQLIAELTPTLSQLIKLSSDAASGFPSVPLVRLMLFPLGHVTPREWTPLELPGILRAFAQLACHSQRLDDFPGLKTQFWLCVMRSKMASQYATNEYEREFVRGSFPDFVVDFSAFQDRWPARIGVLDENDELIGEHLEDALVEFMTTPLPYPTTPSVQPQPSPSFGFVFKKCGLRTASLERLERILDRILASNTRPYAFRMLEVSDDCLTESELDILERIVRKCVHDHGLEDLRLEGLTAGISAKLRANWTRFPTMPAPMFNITRTVFATDTHSVIASSKPAEGMVRPPRLRRFSMNSNVFSAELFAMRFSALRYGCVLEEDTTTYTTITSKDTTDESFSCWRWLAFGLFFPRPRRFARRLRLRNIGRIEHCPLMTETIAKTLRNPAAELIFGGQDSTILEPTTELLVCVIQAGASIEIFQTGNKTTPGWTDTITDTCELEAIYECADGAVCVVVPSVGLGWVQSESVVRIEREPLSSSRSEQDGLYAVSLDLGEGWSAVTRSSWSSQQREASRQSVLETVGTQFFSLDIGAEQFGPGFLPVVLAHCTKLTRLSLRGCYVPKGEGDALLDALSGPLSRRLEVLILNDFGKATKTCYERLFTLLHDAANCLALREIRCGGRYMTLAHLSTLHSALQANTKLSVVYAAACGNSTKLQDMKDRLNADFHGQLLRPSLSSQAKLAFLTVVTGNHRPIPALQALDSWQIKNIFAFARAYDERRIVNCG